MQCGGQLRARIASDCVLFGSGRRVATARLGDSGGGFACQHFAGLHTPPTPSPWYDLYLPPLSTGAAVQPTPRPSAKHEAEVELPSLHSAAPAKMRLSNPPFHGARALLSAQCFSPFET